MLDAVKGRRKDQPKRQIWNAVKEEGIIRRIVLLQVRAGQENTAAREAAQSMILLRVGQRGKP